MEKERREKPTFHITVFCGSSAPNQEHEELAKGLASGIAKNGYGLVNGGGPGLMEIMARHAHESGAYVTGVHFELEGREKSKYNTETVSFGPEDLRDRQMKTMELGNAYVALPGGLGTIYEAVEVVSLKHVKTIDRTRPLILVGKEYWEHFDAMYATAIDHGYARPEVKDLYIVVDSVNEVMEEVRRCEESGKQ